MSGLTNGFWGVASDCACESLAAVFWQFCAFSADCKLLNTTSNALQNGEECCGLQWAGS